MLKLSDALRSLDAPREIQPVSAKLLGERLQVNQAHYSEVNDDDDYIDIRHSYEDGLPSMTGRFRHRDFGERLIEGYRAGKVQVCSDISTDPTISEEERKVVEAAHIGAYIAVPLVKSGNSVAILAVHSIKPRKWKHHEISLVEETAERTWAAVERAQAEEALRKSEEKYRTLFNSIDEGFCTFDMIFDDAGTPIDYRFVDYNPAFEQHTGLTGVIGRTVREFLPEQDEHWFEIYGRVAVTGEPIRVTRYGEALKRWIEATRSGVVSRSSGEWPPYFPT